MNDHQKAFELTQPKSAEEIAQESLKKMMPQLRRANSEDPRLKKFVGAKWLFGVLTDNSFLFKLGGDGWGRVYTSLKDLHRRYGHDEDTLASWRDKLISTGWIWYQDRWPKSCWGIMGACQQPELFSPHADFVRIMAKESSETQPPVAVGVIENGKTVSFGQNGHSKPADQPNGSVIPTASGGQSDRESRSYQPNGSVTLRGEIRSDQPNGSVTPTGSNGHSDRANPVTPTGSNGHIRETPWSKGVKETQECVPGATARADSHSPLPKFESLDPGMVIRLRQKYGPDMIERIKSKVGRMEISRTPLPNQKEIIAAYRQRIRDIKDWMDGEIPSEKKAAGGTAART